MLQVDVSLFCIFIGNFNAESAVRPLFDNIVSMIDEASAIPLFERIDERINEIKKVFSVSRRASKK